MAMYQPSSSSSSSSPSPASSSRTQSSYGYYANGDVYLPPVNYERNDSPGANNISVHERSVMIEKMSRYSAEERKERIERYRSKRNQRNFQKKITYECRKTLADSRPRIRGRFARNDEAEVENTGTTYGNYNHNQVSNDLTGTENGKAGGAESYDDEELWAILYDDSSYVNI